MIKRDDKYLWKPKLEASPMAFLTSPNFPVSKAAHW